MAELEGVFLRAFLADYGAYPISNNQSGIEMRSELPATRFDIDWRNFESLRP